MRFLSIPVLAILLSVSAPLAAEEIVLFTVDVKLSGTGVTELEVNLLCDLDKPLSLDITIPVDSSRTFTAPAPEDRGMTCVLTTAELPGHRLKFLGDGGSVYDPDGAGCTFTDVWRGHSNFCQIQVENENTSLTVSKR